MFRGQSDLLIQNGALFWHLGVEGQARRGWQMGAGWSILKNAKACLGIDFYQRNNEIELRSF